MGVFIRNKTKRVQKNEEKLPVLVNQNPDKSLIGEEINVIEKKPIRTGLGDKKIVNPPTKKAIIDDVVIKKEEIKEVKIFEQPKREKPISNLITNSNLKTESAFETKVINVTKEHNEVDLVKNIEIPKNYALVTILNDSFAEYFYVFINSFLENNAWFNGDIVIFHNNDLSKLSNNNIKKLSLLYRKVSFKHIETNQYSDIIELFKSKVNQNFHRFIPSILTIETFNLTEYDRVLYLDSDMLVVKDINDLFLINCEIAATRDTSTYTTNTVMKSKNDNSILLNGGFLLLDANFTRGKNHVKNMIDLFPKLNNPTFLDQSLMNEYFKNFDVLFLSSDYNVLKRCFSDDNSEQFNSALKNIKIIHYVGEKPWNPKIKEFEKKYKKIEGLWESYYQRYRNISTKMDAVTLISSGIDRDNLLEIIPRINNSEIVTTNWGFKYANELNIDYYYCSTPEDSLLNEIVDNNFKPNKLWLLTDNVCNKLSKKKKEKLLNVNPFNFMASRSNEYYSILNKRKKNKKLPLPTSGVSMLLFFSTTDIKKINIVGYNLYTKVKKDGSYKEHGTSKFVNPYTDPNKPHKIEFDLNLTILALKKLIKNKVDINFYDSKIIKEIYDSINNGATVGEIITEVKLKYYN